MYRHKNVKSLIGMFKILVEKYHFDGQLVIAGKNDFFSNELYSYIKNEHLESKIIMPGIINYVSDADIIALRKTAEVYVFPSLKEGFSLTPMEGMALGLPAVISDIPCHKEVYKDSVIYFDPNNELDIAEKVNSLLVDKVLRDTYIKKGYDLIGQYSWKTTAQTTLDVFKKYL
jgi:glycosyltransferase involved in cell wall biosynthesis